MEFKELLLKRRSIREFEEREVPLELVKEIIGESVMAPSGGGAQPCSFIVVYNREMQQRIAFDSTYNQLASMDYCTDMLRKEDCTIFYNAPCLIIITGPADWMTIVEDCSLAAAYIMFAATERGLGTCWIGMGAGVADPDLLAELGVEQGHKIYAPIILGYPAESPPLPKHEPPNIIRII